MKISWTVQTRILVLCVAVVITLATALPVHFAPAAETVKIVSIADFEKDTDGFGGPLRRDAAVAQQGQGSGRIEATFSSNNRAEIAPAVKGPGYFELLLTVDKRGETVAEGQTTFAVVTPVDLRQMPDSPFGVMTHFAQGWDVDIMPLIAKAGIRSIRDEQYWQQVEKKPGEFVFADKFTVYMAEARRLHIDPLIPMTFANKLYDEGLTPYTPAGCQAYGRYGQAILDPYGRQVRWLEIWNEYNGTWCKGPAAEDRPKFYTQMLKYAYEAIKAKRPDVKVAGGAAVLLPPPYFEAIFEHGGLDYMDAVVIHPYRSEPEGVEEEIVQLVVPFFIVCYSCMQVGAQDRVTRLEVWMAPPSYDDGKCFRELFEKSDDWRQTRAEIDVLMYADHWLHKQFTDDELRAWFFQLRQWRLDFALEVGAVKPWGKTGEKTFQVQRPMWDRFRRLGGEIHAIALDEPLLCCRKHIHESDDYAVRETANFIALVRKHYPEMLIGDIETYPSIPLEDHLRWLDALEKRLAELQVRGLDFYRLDVNWAEFLVFNRGNWAEVEKLEQHCRIRKLPFSLIYWASGYPSLAKRGLADDSTWYVSVMQQGYDYALAQGSPDQYVIESWLEGPSRSTPETEQFTLTRSVLDFTRRFVKRSQP